MIPVCHLADLPAGESVRIDTAPPIAVFHADGQLYAIDDTCTHQEASLADGWLEGVWSNARCTPLHSISAPERRPACPPAGPCAPTP